MYLAIFVMKNLFRVFSSFRPVFGKTLFFLLLKIASCISNFRRVLF